MSNMFIFNPAEVRTWAGRVLNNFNGGDSNTAIGCSKEFGQQLEKLVQPNVWTGDAAKKNCVTGGGHEVGDAENDR